MKKTVYVFLGPAGSGKGTQARMLEKKFNIAHVSTGDLLRKSINDNMDLGFKIKSILDKGDLIDDQLMMDVLLTELNSLIQEKNTIVLDGFPRNRAQAVLLNDVLNRLNLDIDKVILFETSLPQIIDRITGRRLCTDCNEIFHVKYSPPKKCKPTCEEKFIIRSDDTEEKVKHRYKIYENEIFELLKYYKTKLVKLDANLAFKDVFKSLEIYLNLISVQ